MLIDPYTPFHAYSPILPIKSLILPPWTIQAAFSRMTAFFRLGPQLLSSDVPINYNPDAHLSPDSWNTAKESVDAATVAALKKGETASIRLPLAGKKGLWQWLQPYDLPNDKEKPGPKDGTRVTRFNALDVGEEDTKIRKDPAPYTFIEGYLQLARPLLSENVTPMGK
jgi:hypothetical protein